jgi:hypothetical protein
MGVKVVRGAVTTNSLNYKRGGGTSFVKGDLIRITANGEIELADAVAAGCIHGMALDNYADLTDGDKTSVALFDKDTVLAIPTEAGNAAADYTVGVAYGLVVTSGAQTTDLDVTSSAVLMVVGVPGDDQSFDPNVDDTAHGGDIYVQISQAALDGRIAASA